MLKKIASQLFLIIFLSIISFIIILSIVGIETNKFNKLIINRVSETKILI